jgi:cobalt-precorrin 5A hydrolase
MGQALMLVAGIGCRRGVTAEQVEAAIVAALRTPDPQPRDQLTLISIAAPLTKASEPALAAAAAARGIPLVLIAQADLEANNAQTLTHSSNSMKAMNVHSVAEAAALAGAGEGSHLLGPRIAVGPVTCALAVASSSAAAHPPAVPRSAVAPTRPPEGPTSS